MGEGDKGPNTGGMGAYSPAPAMTPGIERQVLSHCPQMGVPAPKLLLERHKGHVLQIQLPSFEPGL